MKKQIISTTIAAALLTGAAHNVYASEQEPSSDNYKQYLGAGIGATAGALVAGPVGFIVGGLVGSLAGQHDAMADHNDEQYPDVNATVADAPSEPVSTASEAETDESLVIAQTGEIDSVINDTSIDHASGLEDSLVKNIRLDVFFLSGSTAIETFYKSRIQAVADIMQQLPGIDIYLEGHSDRRGDKDTNLALSNKRLNSVHNELVQAGIDADRIHMDAYGEQQLVSSPGDLEAYTFDRRVVIRFGYSTPKTETPLALTENSPSL